MISNLGFVYPQEEVEYEFPMQREEPRPAPAAETYDLPAQLEFQLASKPLIDREIPQPMAYQARLKEAARPKPKQKTKPTLYPAKVKSKFSGFTGITGKSLQRLAVLRKLGKKQDKEVRKRTQSQDKQSWNQDVHTPGLFDTRLTKKLPIQVLHQTKFSPTKPAPKSASKPKVFRDWEDVKTEPSPLPEPNAPNPRKPVKLTENLEVKFIADQEAVISQLEKQLLQEQIARKTLDKQYALRMKELERLKCMDRQVENAKKVYVETRSKPKNEEISGNYQSESRPKSGKDKIRPAVLSPSVKYPKPVSSSQLKTHIEVLKDRVKSPPGDVIDYPVEADLGDIHEEPTRERPNTAPVRKTKEAGVKPAVYHPVPAEQIISEVEADIKAAKDIEIRDFYPQEMSGNRPMGPKSVPSYQYGTVSGLVKRADLAEKYGARTVGLVSRVSSKFVAYYAEDLTDLLAEELLSDTVMELQRIEEVMHMRSKQELRQEAGEMMQGLVQDWQDKVNTVQEKWKERPKPMKTKEVARTTEAPVQVIATARRWEVHIPDRELRSIRSYQRDYAEYQRVQTSGTKLWEIYGQIGDLLLSEVLEAALSDFDESLGTYTDQVISQELN